MKIKVVGVREVSYTNKQGQPVIGRELSYINLSTEREGLTGYEVGSQFIRNDAKAYQVPVEVGAEYTMYKDGYRVDYFEKIEEGK